MRRLTIVLIAGVLLACSQEPRPATRAVPSPAGLTATVTNGARYTVDGKRIDSHSGNVLYADGYYYLYGDTYGCGFVWTDAATPFCGGQAYRSRDLMAWSGPWPLFDASAPYWQRLCMHTPDAEGNGCFRHKVAYNAMTRRYVLWVNVPDGYRVLTSPKPLGPFALAGKPDLHDSHIGGWDGKPANPGDHGLFVDRDGSGWLSYNRDGTLVVERLTPDYLSGAGEPQAIRNYPDLAFHGVEAPSMFRHGGTYYIVMDLGRCPYCPATRTAVETAPSPAGPWTYAGLISQDSCGGQPNSVDVLPGGTYLYSSDQWRHGDGFGIAPRLNETNANQHWAPLAISDGKILPIACASSYGGVALPHW